MLHRWRLLDARAQVLKHVSTTPLDTHKGVEFQSECQLCGKVSRGPQCMNCKRLALECVICHISVRGKFNFIYKTFPFLTIKYIVQLFYIYI